MDLLVATLFFFIFQLNPGSQNLPDSSLYREEYLNAAKQGDTVGMARAWFKQGAAFDDLGEFGASRHALEQALSICQPLAQPLIEGKIRNYLASVLGELGQRDQAIDMYQLAYQCYMSAGDTALAANVLINIGIDYVNFGRYEEALITELRALDLRIKCNDSSNLATYYQHIGEVYKQLNLRDQWKEYLEKARALSANPAYATFYTRIGILNDLGGVYEHENRFEQAIAVYQDMYGQSKVEGYLNGMATARNNLASVYLALDSVDLAYAATQEALTLQEERGSDYGVLCARNQLGEINLRLSKLSEAEKQFRKALTLAEFGDYVFELRTSLKGLYACAKAQGRFREALQYHEKYLQLGDSLHGIEIQEKIADLKTRYETEKKEQQILLLSQESELKSKELRFREAIIAGGSLLFLFLTGLLIFWMRHRRIQSMNRQNMLEQKLLRSQMNPHFLFNSLGSIQNYMLQNEGRKAAFYLGNFSQLMRAILKNSREEVISLKEEIQTLENYLLLQQMRMGERLTYSINADPSLDPESVLLPPMLVQPFVENAIQHGLKDLHQSGMIQVNFKRLSNVLEISVIDNGCGVAIQDSREQGHISYALEIFKERIRNMIKVDKQDILFRIEPADPGDSTRPGTRVVVQLPLRTEI